MNNSHFGICEDRLLHLNGTKRCDVSSTNKTEYFFAGSYHDISTGSEIGQNASSQMENCACIFAWDCDPKVRVQNSTGLRSDAAS